MTVHEPSASGSATAAPRLDPRAAVGPVSLVAQDRAALSRWYQSALGLSPLAETERVTVLGTAGGTPLVTLVGDPQATVGPRRQSGLFHVAILLSTRADLGRWLAHASRSGLRIEGAADHLVSEAVYLSDPEGNGIEIYRDRPRDAWPLREGRIHMDNSPFDVAGVAADAEAAGGSYGGAPEGTIVGHVHLKVDDIGRARAFYEGLVGFDVTEEGYASALFVAAGGYHHHIGLNTWRSAGARRVPGTTGLDAVTVTLPAGAAEPLAERLAAAGAPVERRGGHPAAIDPAGNRVVLLEGAADARTAVAAAGG
ncbi:MAG TPA: VOC family protein [Methylomirabilota bacterium]|nr:VOC family protein [Methylomirabilota bacterium]